MIISKRAALSRERLSLKETLDYQSGMLSCERKYASESYYLGRRITMELKREVADEIDHYKKQIFFLKLLPPNSKVKKIENSNSLIEWQEVK